MIRTPNFKMTLGTVNFDDEDIKSRVRTIVVNQESDGASSFKIQLDDYDDAFAKGKFTIREGDQCVISLGYYEEELNQVIIGNVTSVKANRKEYSRKLYEVSGFDGLQALTRGRRRRSWEQIKDSEIAELIAGECGLGADVDDSGIVHPYIVQNNVNNLTFLYERARRLGFEVKVVDRNLVFKRATKTSSGVTLRWNVDGRDGDTSILQRCNFDTSTMNVVEKVVVRGYDRDTGKPIIASSSDLLRQNMGDTDATSYAQAYNLDTTIQISDQPVNSTEEAEKLAQSILNQRDNNFLTGRGSCEGNSKLTCGKTVNIKDIGAEMDGEYFISSCRHTLKAGTTTGCGYWTEFSISRSGRN